MNKIRGFHVADRYFYDAGPCSSSNGFAQVDTKQDASYYGTWANPETFTIFCYCEGDTTKTICDNVEEFKTEMYSLKAWNEENGYWLGVDPGWHEKDGDKWREIGLGDLLH